MGGIMDGIAFGTQVGFAVCMLLLMPVLLPVACMESLRQRLAGARILLALRGGALARPMPLTSIVMMATVLMALGCSGCWTCGAGSPATLVAMVFAVTVTAVCAGVCCAAMMLLSVIGAAGRSPLPASFRFDTAVMNAVRSWARPQWVPRWARYTLPDSRI